MRICLISREYPPDTGWGGIATFTNNLALGLAGLGHEVEVVALAIDKPKTMLQGGVRVHRVPPFAFKGGLGRVNMTMPYTWYVLRTSFALWQKFLELHQERAFDVVDTPELLAEGLFPAATRVAPLVIRLYTPHSKFIAERLHNVTPSFDHQSVALFERVAMLSADLLTSPSNDLADYVASDLNYERDKIRIVHNPIDTDLFSPELPESRTSSGQPSVLFVGRLEERKGINYLIDAVPRAVAAVPNVRFVIIGSDTNNAGGQKSVLAELRRSLKRSGCEHSVQFIPQVSLEELPAYYRSADVCVVPSVYDNSPYTCLEAMSCGKPVVGTTSGGTAEYLGEAGLLVPARDSTALAEAIIRLLRDPELQAQLGAAARRRVLERFRRSEIARQTVELYELAREHFRFENRSALYLRSSSQALPDAHELLFSFDKALFDLMYTISWRVRLNHWFTLLRTRPRLLAAKVLLRFANSVLNCFGWGDREAPAAIVWLDREVRSRQLSALEDSKCPEAMAVSGRR